MENQFKTEQEIEQEMLELNNQFSEFLHTKGIIAKFKLAFNNMGESARKQHEKDVASFEAVKTKSAEENKEFVEFLHTKGIKAKFHLVVNNIKNGAKNAPADTAKQIARAQAQAQAGVARANAYASSSSSNIVCSAESLTKEFNEFLKMKGLDGQYTVSITE
ncbi:MAG: hypothetical protein E7602_03365 [Ruminococcaceae bacterium]|nr:hypothetical protein [Oscillospiraceae bacterium]